MFSKILYFSLKKINLRGRVPFIAALLVVLTLVVISIDPPKVLFTGFLLYVTYGPILFLGRLRQRARRRNQPPTEPPGHK